jgi:hypothetical protein
MFDRWMPDDAARSYMAGLTPMNYIAHPDDMARGGAVPAVGRVAVDHGRRLPCEGGMSAG